MAQLLAGAMEPDEEQANPVASPKKPTPPTKSKDTPKGDSSKGADDDDTAESGISDEEEHEPGDGPVLSEDEPATEDDDDDSTEAEGEADDPGKQGNGIDKATQAKLFKLREARRELQEQLKAKDEQLKKVEERVAALAQGDAAKAVAFDGFFSGVKTEEELQSSESWLEQRLAYLEDNEEGFFETDGNGGEVERDAKWIKQQRRAVLAELKRVPAIRQTLETVATRQKDSTERARKLYPFVFNVSSKFHDGVLELAKETPELSSAPNKALLLGRLRIAQLVESGEYTLVPKVKPKAGTTAKAVSDPEPEPGISARKPASQRSSASPAATARTNQQPNPAANPQPKRGSVDSRSADALDWALDLVGGGASH